MLKNLGFLQITAALIAFASILSVIGGLFFFADMILYGRIALYICAIAICLLKAGHLRFFTTEALFLVYLLLNILTSVIDPVFNVWQRFLFFIVILFLFSPLFQNNTFHRFRSHFFRYLLGMMVIVSAVSFACYFLGINLMFRYGEYLEEFQGSAGSFSGITSHSMLLGPIAGVSAVYMFWQYIQYKKVIILVLMMMCIGSCLFAASRAAFLSMIIGSLYILYKSTHHTGSFVKNILLFVIPAILTFPIWDNAMEGLEKKQRQREGIGVYDSRTEKVENRIAEFISSPLIGIGFQTVDLTGSDAPNRRGNIEPGSSWLCVLSMTGIIGMLFIISILYKSFHVSKSKLTRNKILYQGILVFFIVHLAVEGYIFASGSFFCMLLWLIIGINIDYIYHPSF